MQNVDIFVRTGRGMVEGCLSTPSATVDWADKIKQSIETANTEQKEIILLGDINFNLLSQSFSTKAWLEMTI